MELPETTQAYIVAPVDPIYHLASSDHLTLCGLWVFGKPDQRRRTDDRRLVAEKPTGQFTALCSQCERKANGAPEPERPSFDLLRPPCLIEIVRYPQKLKPKG